MIYSLLKVAHIAIFAAWLGLQIAAFMLYARQRNYDIPVEGRRALHEAHEQMAVGVRLFWMPILALGIVLTNVGKWGFNGTPGAIFVIVGLVIAAAWLAASVHVIWARRTGRWMSDPRIGGRVRAIEKTDTVVRYIIMIVLTGAGIWSLAGDGPIEADWLAWKLLVVAALVAATLAWRRLGRQIAISGRRVLGIDKSQEPDLEEFRRLTFHAQTLLVGFWVLMAIIVWLAVDKPS
jgi:hypothetical protein